MRPVTALLVAAALLAVGSATAFADEYYACEDGRLIRVKPGQLAKLRRTEPCLRAYFRKSKKRSSMAAGKSGSRKASVRRSAAPSKGPNIGTRFSRKRITPKPEPIPVVRAKPHLRGSASMADDVLPPAQGAGADARASRKLQGRLAEARAAAVAATAKPLAAKTGARGRQGDRGWRVRILNAKPGQTPTGRPGR